jgi:hypothetical protein
VRVCRKRRHPDEDGDPFLFPGLVGRAAELRLLDEAWRQAADGPPAVVVVGGGHEACCATPKPADPA